MTVNQFLATWEKGVRVDNPEALQNLAGELAEFLNNRKQSLTILLYGEMGAGKTTFTQGLARAWEITQAVTSPTYNLMNAYRGSDWTLLHLDAYRLKPGDSTDVLMLDELKVDPYCLVIEWPENVPHLCDNAHVIRLKLEIIEGSRVDGGRILHWLR